MSPVILEIIYSISVVLIIQVAVILLARIFLKIKRESNLPQPFPLPLVGNLLQLGVRPLEKLLQWSKKYGPIYGIHIGKKYFIVLNNHEVVNDLIVKRGAIYSSRYDFNHPNSILIKSNLTAMTPYGNKWKRDRSIAYSALTSGPIKSYYNYIYNDSDQLVKYIMRKHGQSIDPLQIIKKFVLTNMLNILFGEHTKGDAFFNEAMNILDAVAEFSSPTNILPDLIPILNYVYKSNAIKGERIYKQMEKVFSSKYDEFLRDYTEGKTLSPSFLLQIQEAIHEKENASIEYEDVWQMLVGLLNGAMETEVNTLMWAIACLANNPGAQEEAFNELDELCDGSMPTLADEIDLPYINAIINETLRYRPPNAFGFIHLANEDDEYNGNFIPKGTPLLLNLFAINHNERRFITPNKFRPSRFMGDSSTGSVKSRSILLPQLDFNNENGANNNKKNSLYGFLKNNSPSLSNSSMPMHMSFGAGRRYCIGQHLAQKQIFLALARILWAFEIKPDVSEDGKTSLYANLDDGKLSLTSYSPSPYKVRFQLRKDIGLLIA